MLLLLVLLLSFSPSFPGQPQLEEDLDPDLGDFDLDIAPRRVPRQVKAILVKVGSWAAPLSMISFRPPSNVGLISSPPHSLPVAGVSSHWCNGGSRCPGLGALVCAGALPVAAYRGLGLLAWSSLCLGRDVPQGLGSLGPWLDLLQHRRLLPGPVGSSLQLPEDSALWLLGGSPGLLVSEHGLQNEALNGFLLSSNLTKEQNGFKITLKTLEDNLLSRLSSASGNFLGDTELVENLETTKRTAAEIEQKVKEAKVTEAKINEAREHYRPAAARASFMYFIMNDLNKIHPMYQFSLKVALY
ncbi:hypothetical protein AMECASPLE_007206 [Ameca splendens]|uniref:Dynein heavy chain ATP-binding dynein motor region domain-containing protein n=1 Tax=Ameca splendens TaxID=208324 RepID=A0ABV1A7J9_9TELE